MPKSSTACGCARDNSVAVIVHNARVILSCERVILNIMQRMSGIATLTRRYVDAVAGTGATILDTRKTAPGLRVLDKWAVRCGGGTNHRLDLSDGVLIKNNHIALAGGVVPALERAVRNRRGITDDRDRSAFAGRTQAGAGAWRRGRAAGQHDAGADSPGGGVCRTLDRKVPLEASGGITLENIRAYAEAGVNFISVGALTHSVAAVDLSMRFAPV